MMQMIILLRKATSLLYECLCAIVLVVTFNFNQTNKQTLTLE